MIIVQSIYEGIGNPEMTANFIINSGNLLKVWDITTHIIGIRFISTYDAYEYRINLEEPSMNILAADILEMIQSNVNQTISGRVQVN